MKNSPDSNFIPILTTEAGRCLTMENWREVGVKMVSYDLTSLLMKPGFELLGALPDLATYTGWQGKVVLNAAMPEMDREGGYTLRSEYDGSRRRYTPDDILMLIGTLQPQLVLLPKGMHPVWHSLPDTILPFFSSTDLPIHTSRLYGVNFIYDAAIPFSSLVQQIQMYSSLPCYVGGKLGFSLMRELAAMGVEYLASDVPARDACQGMVSSQGNIISLKDEAYRLDFTVIDEQCHCPTCKQQLTKAYLHHLLEHTPLLCERFLIQHNVLEFGHATCKNTHVACPNN